MRAWGERGVGKGGRKAVGGLRGWQETDAG